MTISVGIVGVGDMGSELVPHLVADGYSVTAFDVDPVRLDAAVAAGAQRAVSPYDAAARTDVFCGPREGAKQRRGDSALVWGEIAVTG